MKQTIKTMLLSFLLSAAIGNMQAQAPQKFNYQGVARDAQGNPFAKKSIALKISILPSADATEPEYIETQQVSTNEFGLYALQIGGGTSLLGDLKSVSWEKGNKYIKVSIDANGGSNYLDAGTTQLLSVPYAIYSDKSGIAMETVHGSSSNATRAGSQHFLSKFDATGSSAAEINSQIYDNGSNIGIGTTSPGGKIHSRVTSGNNLTIFENTNNTGTTRMNFQADGATNYTTVQKRGSNVAGSATVATIPLANLFSFGNNQGAMLLNSQGNMGIAPTISGVLQYKFLTDTLSGNVGLAGNAIPTARVHVNNTQDVNASVRITNNTTGHTANDGLEINTNGLQSSIVNRENGAIVFGTNNIDRMKISQGGNVGIGTNSPNTTLSVGANKWNVDGAEGDVNFSDPQASIQFPATIGTNAPMINMFSAGTQNNTRMVIAHSPSFTNWGLQYHDSTDKFNFLSGGTDVMTVDLGGQRVGIGTNTPSAKLEVAGQVKITGGAPGLDKVLTSDANGLATWQTPEVTDMTGSTNTIPKITGTTSLGASRISDDGNQVRVGTTASSGSSLNVGERADQDTASISLNTNGQLFTMFVNNLGQVQFTANSGNPAVGTPSLTLDDGTNRSVVIGTVASMPTGYKLFVEDGILTERLKVAVNGSAQWADYVFASDYKLMPLEDVEAFVQEHKHLPNVPSADKMVETGIDVATVDAKLMEKIEELTLYMIDMKKEMKKLSAENESIKSQLKSK
jgi:hypothetical protein